MISESTKVAEQQSSPSIVDISPTYLMNKSGRIEANKYLRLEVCEVKDVMYMESENAHSSLPRDCLIIII